MNEEAVLLGAHRSLVGVYTPAITDARSAGGTLAVVMLNAGLIHHVGPHRLHVILARTLAARGISALRVDLSGIGDSLPRPDSLPAAQLGFQEPREVLDFLAARGYQRFVLFGICSGAKHALQAVAGDRRITGMVLINQESGSEDAAAASQISTQYYLRRSLWNPRAWLNLVTGRVKYKALFGAFARALGSRVSAKGRQSTLVELVRRELTPAREQGCKLLMILSDRHAQYVEFLGDGLRDMESSGQLQIEVYPEADHLFTGMAHQAMLIERVCHWVRSLQSENANATAGSTCRAAL